jgi:uncharacterized membrane protein
VAAYGFYFAHPWWLLAALAVVPLVWVALRSLRPLSKARRWTAIVVRVLVVLLLAALLARPMLTRRQENLTVIAVVDRSLSVPEERRKQALDYLEQAVADAPQADRLAVVDVAEQARIARLPTTSTQVPRRNISLSGRETHLADGVQMAMAIAPPDTAVRIVLLTDGRETVGDLSAAARVAGANNVPIDVRPLQYRYDREVVMRRLSAPSRARRGQTVPLRFILRSTHAARGELTLTLNGRPADLDPGSERVGVDVQLKPGTNVHTVSMPIAEQGLQEFRATFRPEGAGDDRVPDNNVASAVTIVQGPGRVVVVDTNGSDAQPLLDALRAGDVGAEYMPAEQVPQSMASLLDIDAIVLVNTPANLFSLAQQEMLKTYVTDLGGGLVMVGGPDAFGAGGWIGSPVAEVLPVDPDPPQKMQMPKGALVMSMHACEMPQGNYWGKRVAVAAVNALSRRDEAGVLAYAWQGQGDWIYPLSEVGDKTKVTGAIRKMEMGDLPDFRPHMQAALKALTASDAAQKHMIIISDGDPAPPSAGLLKKFSDAGITCSGVAVFPHNPSDVASLRRIAMLTGGRFYYVKKPQNLPKIFIKEARMVRRSLIVEERLAPVITDPSHSILRGIDRLPALEGYVLTGRKAGLSRMLLANEKHDPLLGAVNAGLGQCVAFTSSASSRWAPEWLAWGGFSRFWKQAVEWAQRSQGAKDIEVYTDVDGRNVTLTLEAADAETAERITHIAGHVIAPDMTRRKLDLAQVGPGQYRATFKADQGGSFVVNLRHRSRGEQGGGLTQAVVTVPFSPEFESLTDNTPLLAEVAATTGGRMLPPEPADAKLFGRAGVSFPHVARPLLVPLMIAWVALFLLDVAVRRVAVDFRAAFRRMGALVTFWRRRPQRVEAMDQLRAKRRKWAEQLRGRGVPDRRQRYQAPEGAEQELPMSRAEPRRAPERPGEQAPQTEEPEAPEKPSTHVDELLRAKRKKRPKDEDREQD